MGNEHWMAEGEEGQIKYTIGPPLQITEECKRQIEQYVGPGGVKKALHLTWIFNNSFDADNKKGTLGRTPRQINTDIEELKGLTKSIRRAAQLINNPDISKVLGEAWSTLPEPKAADRAEKILFFPYIEEYAVALEHLLSNVQDLPDTNRRTASNHRYFVEELADLVQRFNDSEITVPAKPGVAKQKNLLRRLIKVLPLDKTVSENTLVEYIKWHDKNRSKF